MNIKQLAVIITLALSVLVGVKSAYANEPPTPEPPIWDRSSFTVAGACQEGVPVFTITNTGSGNMSFAREYWFLYTDGGASDCGADTAGLPASGTFQLLSGESVDIVFPKNGSDPPYRLCVIQALGHPGIGYTSATIGPDDVCVTAEPEAAEPPSGIRFMFIPLAKR